MKKANCKRSDRPGPRYRTTDELPTSGKKQAFHNRVNKEMDEISPAQHEAAKFRWEFMRITEEYKRDFKIKARDEAKLFCVYYGIEPGPLPDPKKAWAELSGLEQARIYSGMKTVQLYAPLTRPGYAEIRIDFSRVNNVEALRAAVDAAINQYVHFHPEALRKKYRRSGASLSDILKAGKLAAHYGNDIREIARHLDLKEVNEKEKKVRWLLDKFKCLVNGGWRELTFP